MLDFREFKEVCPLNELLKRLSPQKSFAALCMCVICARASQQKTRTDDALRCGNAVWLRNGALFFFVVVRYVPSSRWCSTLRSGSKIKCIRSVGRLVVVLIAADFALRCCSAPWTKRNCCAAGGVVMVVLLRAGGWLARPLFAQFFLSVLSSQFFFLSPACRYLFLTMMV